MNKLFVNKYIYGNGIFAIVICDSPVKASLGLTINVFISQDTYFAALYFVKPLFSVVALCTQCKCLMKLLSLRNATV